MGDILYMGENLTQEEIVQYGDSDQLRKLCIELLGEKDELPNETRRIEILEEQLYFARELIDNIEKGLLVNNRMRDFKKYFDDILSNSMFET